MDKAIKDAGDLVTPDELAGLQAKLAEAQKEKQAAQDAVNALPDTVKDQKDGFQGRLDKLVDPTLPTVNDADNNGIADDVDQQVKNAKDLVEKAEKAYADLDKAIKDAGDLVTPDELAGLQAKLA
ncbi:GA-like domain-containing protein, partial [Streptococcus agalactiae]|uniref:GA-like domain-containing protein n=1 Tax=Streptococcus agalactiae TaxID=1311 RepID=UPI00221E601D